MQRRVSLAELIDSDISLRPDEAVAIVRDVCRQYADGALRGIPNPAVIRLTVDGAIVVEGPVSRDQSPVPAAAGLLGELLPGFHGANGFKVPGALRLVLARAIGALDVPPFANTVEFCDALERFAAPDPAESVRGLFQSWSARQDAYANGPSKELTISDVRRARRATGLSLEDVSRACGIDAGTLRELEWGYVRNWRADDEGREHVCRYARAAGLDEDLVISVAWPLIESEARGAACEPRVATSDAEVVEAEWALVPAGPQTLVSHETPTASWGWQQYRWMIAFAAAVLLVAIVLLTGSEQGVAPPVIASAVPRAARPPQPPAAAADDRVLQASYTSPPPAERAAPEGPRARKKPARPSRQAHRSFFRKELFRIVFR